MKQNPKRLEERETLRKLRGQKCPNAPGCETPRASQARFIFFVIGCLLAPSATGWTLVLHYSNIEQFEYWSPRAGAYVTPGTILASHLLSWYGGKCLTFTPGQ